MGCRAKVLKRGGALGREGPSVSFVRARADTTAPCGPERGSTGASCGGHQHQSRQARGGGIAVRDAIAFFVRCASASRRRRRRRRCRRRRRRRRPLSSPTRQTDPPRGEGRRACRAREPGQRSGCAGQATMSRPYRCRRHTPTLSCLPAAPASLPCSGPHPRARVVGPPFFPRGPRLCSARGRARSRARPGGCAVRARPGRAPADPAPLRARTATAIRTRQARPPRPGAPAAMSSRPVGLARDRAACRRRSGGGGVTPDLARGAGGPAGGGGGGGGGVDKPHTGGRGGGEITRTRKRARVPSPRGRGSSASR